MRKLIVFVLLALSCAAQAKAQQPVDYAGIRLFSGRSRDARQLLFTPDGKHLIYSGLGERDAADESTNSPIFIIELQRSATRRLEGHADEVLALAVSPDGRHLLSGGKDGEMCLWDLESGEKLRGFAGNEGAVHSVSFSPDGSQALSGCDDAAMRLWDVSTGKLLRQYEGHSKGPLLVAFTPDGRAMSASNGDERLRLWNLTSGQQVFERSLSQPCIGIAFGPDSQTVQCIKPNGLRSLKLDGESGSDMGSGNSAYYLPPWPSRYAIRFGPTRPMELLDVSTKSYQSVRRLLDNESKVAAVALTADAKTFAWVTSNGQLGIGTVEDRPLATAPRKPALAPVQTPGQFPPQVRHPTTPYSYVLFMAPDPKRTQLPSTPVVVLDEEVLQAARPAHHAHTLARELVRQAILLAASEELGLLTRDVRLGEWTQPIADGQGARVKLELQVFGDVPGTMQILLRPTGSRNPVWQYRFKSESKDISAISRLVELAEGWSRKEIPAALRAAGFQRSDKKPRGEGELAESAKEHLHEMTFTSQFAALRSAHEAIRSQGESTELIGALARANAHLGLLTESHWTAVNKTFKARGLLYAQRLAMLEPESPLAAWHLAYAKALCGYHGEALENLEHAAAAKGNAEQPAWVEAIDAYCRFDAERLAELGADSPLARLLRFFAVYNPYTAHRTLQAAGEVLEENPECFRVYDAMCELGGIGNLHSATTMPVAVLWATLPARMAQMQPPEAVTKLLSRGEEDEGPAPGEIAAGLRQLSKPDDDAAEPAWGALASMIDELQFSQAVRRIAFMRYQWSVPVDEYLQQLEQQFGKHRFWPILAMYGQTGVDQRQTVSKLLDDDNLVRLDLALRQSLLQTIEQRFPDQLSQNKHARTSTGPGYAEFGARIELEDYYPAKARLARELERISPHSPLAKATLVHNDMQLTDEQLAEYERSSAKQPGVLYLLGLRHKQFKRYDEAERVLKLCIAQSPDYGPYAKLAEIYKLQGKMDLWEETLVAFLDEESPGLEDTRVRVELGSYYMAQQQWEEATAYAEEAAQSYAAWAMGFAVRCYQAQGRLQEADAWFVRIIERYPGHELEYAIWRRANKLLDEEHAARDVQLQIDRLAQRTPADQQHVVGGQYLANGFPRQALTAFSKAYLQASDPRGKLYNGLFVVLLADEFDKPGLRDETLRALAKIDEPSQARSRQFVTLLQQWIADTPGEEVVKQIEELLDQATPEDNVNLSYFAARYLLAHGQTKPGIELLMRATSVENGERFMTRGLATIALSKTEPPGEDQSDEQ